MVSVEEVVSGDLSKGIVQAFREKLLAESTEEDLKPQVINDKIVYVCFSPWLHPRACFVC